MGNPILKGQYADPDIAKFNGKYYIYPTTDGFDGWSGTVFKVFSSTDLINWDEGKVILDLSTDDVPWASGNAWAPAIEHKNGKYYFYFCGRDKSDNQAIGVAVSDFPDGPFKSMESPLITIDLVRNEGIKLGQAIDPIIYTEKEDSYILFGNGDAVIAKLNEDMLSIDISSLRQINGLVDFREAVTVFKKEGIYHFTWSCDDTGSPDYHVNYGVSDSLFNDVAYKYTILRKDENKGILGTGHHAILEDEGKYYISYHRFFTPLDVYKEGKGFHRETCIDKIEFDENGFIKEVKPT